MADFQNVDARPADHAAPGPSRPVGDRAAAALIRDNALQLDAQLLARLHDAMLSSAPHAGRSVARQAVMAGIRSEDIADHYIPALARSFGDLWVEDELSFAEVTIAVARLQALLRDLEIYWPNASAHDPRSGATVMLILPRDVFHTLGAFVLAGQMRRQGISVKLVLGRCARTIAGELSRAKFDAIFVSASQSESLGPLKATIEAVHAAAVGAPPVVVGGGLLDVVSAEKVMAGTGAHYATKNTEEALRYCRLLLTTQDETPMMNRG